MRFSTVSVLLVALGTGFALGIFDPFHWEASLIHLRSGIEPGASDDNTDADKKILYWVAPMDPSYRRDMPGKSPTGMDLVPVYEGAEDAKASSGTVHIDPTVINNIGVRIAKVKRRSEPSHIHTVGRIMYDEDRIAQVHPRADGWIERMHVRAVGDSVKKGDLLYEIYSPALVNAQAEFLQVLRRNKSNVIKESRRRLRALGISEDQIKALETRRTPAQYVKIYAPIDGVITKLGAADGMYVKRENAVMTLADVSTVWLISDVFESDAELLSYGAKVTATSKFDAGLKIIGKVEYIYPTVSPVTRTIPVRTTRDNANGYFKPGMFMSISIEGPDQKEVTLIPREALIRTGFQERVILALGEGHFQPALVVSGREFGKKIEILSGLSPGEMVVVSGQFLIDSESSFAGATLRLTPSADQNMGRGTTQDMDMGAMEGTDLAPMKTMGEEPAESVDVGSKE
jgi:Cu(I)/Ag(I) efflux system membrane fusion protein